MSLNLEQHRIKLAWTLAENAVKQSRCAKWRTAMMGFGTNIHRCGGLQALAFVRRDDSSVYAELEKAAREHLQERGFLSRDAGQDLMVVFRDAQSFDYMVLSRELLALAIWLRRAAQIVCPNTTSTAGGRTITEERSTGAGG